MKKGPTYTSPDDWSRSYYDGGYQTGMSGDECINPYEDHLRLAALANSWRRGYNHGRRDRALPWYVRFLRFIGLINLVLLVSLSRLR
jgi:hypothetical protein